MKSIVLSLLYTANKVSRYQDIKGRYRDVRWAHTADGPLATLRREHYPSHQDQHATCGGTLVHLPLTIGNIKFLVL